MELRVEGLKVGLFGMLDFFAVEADEENQSGEDEGGGDHWECGLKVESG